MSKQKGFTLIELVVVIVILAALSVIVIPRFVNLNEDAERAAFLAAATAFKSGVNQVHLAWQIRGNGQAIQNFIPISDPLAGGNLSVNSFGYPADTRGVSLTLNSRNDCLDVWRAVLDSQSITVEPNDSGDFEARYNGGNTCTYTYNKQTSLTVDYDSNSGTVTVNL